ncbi:hypothetical protein FSP39_001987 [Pinctada imbricata]|uniref:U1-type domain-containing protein n=1 Tax=Pinctada imbricata TaxID=66713 RepID=A0AA89BW62_PINIB|nr:hypothetical protein FSP39_001987 [Pinctada imbricata]
MNSYDRVRKIVQEEGRTARNLVIYNVPVDYPKDSGIKKKDYTSHKKSRSASESDQNMINKNQQDVTKSPKSDGGSRKPDRRARFWKFLFDNLQRAVDAIYETCEQDESVVECKEVIMMLEQSTRDFKSLIEKLHMLRAYEESTKGRPPSIAWEVRKMSPGKSAGNSQGTSRSSPSPAQRVLQFSDQNKQEPKAVSATVSGNSWADKVRGASTTPPQKVASPTTIKSPPLVLPSPPPKQNGHASDADTDGSTTIEDDNEGWETVHRGGKGKARNSPSQRSLENLSGVGKVPVKLKRTLSDPHSGMNKRPPWNHGASRRTPQKSGPPSHHLGASRHRTDSKDSEKENKPLVNQTSQRSENIHRMSSSPQPLQNSNDQKTKASESVPDTDKTSMDVLKSEDPSVIDGMVAGKDSRESEEFTQDIKVISPVLEESMTEDEEVKQIDNALQSAMDEEDQLTSQLEAEQDLALETAIQEEESWLKELAREENTVIEVETETETENELGNTTSSLELSQPSLDWDAIVAQYESRSESERNRSWGDMVEEDEVEARTPGHAVHMHEKLSSPSRKRSPTESKKRHEQKQAKARELREKLLQEKAERLKDLSKKVEEVRSWKEELMQQRKGTIQRKLQRAEEKRQVQLKMKAQKAHEEEAKANEIAFINTLEAQNKKHDIMSKHQTSEARLQDLQEEKKRKHEEKLAKEAAVEERRKALEAERQARLKEMEEKRRQRSARAEQQQIEREKERVENIRAKEREREERLAVLNAQHQQHIQDLQKKIQQKQDETTQRHQEALQQIREKAFEMSVLRHSTEDHNDVPNVVPYENKKLCTICNVLITSEVYLLSHLRGKKHQQALQDNNSGKAMSKEEIESFNLKHIVDAPVNSTHPKIVSEKERLKSMKKRSKKLRQRMTTRGLEYENSLNGKQQPTDSEYRAKIQKSVRDINRYLQTPDTGPWPPNKVSLLDRALGEIGRIVDKKVIADQNTLRVLGGMTSFCRLLQLMDLPTPDSPAILPPKSLSLICTVFKQACKGCYDNCHYMLFSNKIGVVVDMLAQRLLSMLPDDPSRPSSANTSTSLSGASQSNKLPYDVVALSLLQLMSTILSCLAKNNPVYNSSEASAERMTVTGADGVTVRGNDLISYIINVGIVDKLTQYFRGVQGPIDDDKDGAEFLQHGLGLLVAMTKFMSKKNSAIFEKKKSEDPTQLASTYEATELVGIVSLLYGMLLHSGAPSRCETAPPLLPQHTLAVTLTGLKMLNNMATFNIDMLQARTIIIKSLGEEGMSLEFRHIASHLMWYCRHHVTEELLHEVVLSVGYFTVLNPDNQVVIQSGQSPTILQQLCSLPFQYFSDPRLTNVLFPTLMACCYNNQSNREILEQELSCVLLSNFIEEKLLELQQAPKQPSKKDKGKSKEASKDQGDHRMLLAVRFPQNQWTAAQEYFKVS